MGKFGRKKKEEEQVVPIGLKLNEAGYYIGDDEPKDQQTEPPGPTETDSISIGMKPEGASNGQAPLGQGHVNPAFEDGEQSKYRLCLG